MNFFSMMISRYIDCITNIVTATLKAEYATLFVFDSAIAAIARDIPQDRLNARFMSVLYFPDGVTADMIPIKARVSRSITVSLVLSGFLTFLFRLSKLMLSYPQGHRRVAP